MSSKFDSTLKQIQQVLNNASDTETGVLDTMRIINIELPYYSWIGVYWLNDSGDELFIGPYVGAETEHTKIPVGRGVCGTAVAENSNQLVDDVHELDNYIACSLDVRSEIVVLIKNLDGKIIGQIDADSKLPGAFCKKDEAFLERVAKLIASKKG